MNFCPNRIEGLIDLFWVLQSILLDLLFKLVDHEVAVQWTLFQLGRSFLWQ